MEAPGGREATGGEENLRGWPDCAAPLLLGWQGAVGGSRPLRLEGWKPPAGRGHGGHGSSASSSVRHLAAHLESGVLSSCQQGGGPTTSRALVLA